jgi:hypothetical protein
MENVKICTINCYSLPRRLAPAGCRTLRGVPLELSRRWAVFVLPGEDTWYQNPMLFVPFRYRSKKQDFNSFGLHLQWHWHHWWIGALEGGG